jgi:hypothetical protein
LNIDKKVHANMLKWSAIYRKKHAGIKEPNKPAGVVGLLSYSQQKSV